MHEHRCQRSENNLPELVLSITNKVIANSRDQQAVFNTDSAERRERKKENTNPLYERTRFLYE